MVLVSPAFRDIPYPERIAAVLNLWEMGVGLEPLPLTPEEFAERAGQITVVAEAVRTGKAVWP